MLIKSLEWNVQPATDEAKSNINNAPRATFILTYCCEFTYQTPPWDVLLLYRQCNSTTPTTQPRVFLESWNHWCGVTENDIIQRLGEKGQKEHRGRDWKRSDGKVRLQENREEEKKEENAKWERGASRRISGAVEFVFTEGHRQHYGNGCLAASLADCKQDLGKAYSLWWGPRNLASVQHLYWTAALPWSLLLPSAWILCSNLH